MKLSHFLKGTLKYDEEGQYIFHIQENGNQHILGEVRGWGAIQKFFKLPDGQIATKKAEAFQDELGKWIVQALQEKLELESKPDFAMVFDGKAWEKAGGDKGDNSEFWKRAQILKIYWHDGIVGSSDWLVDVKFEDGQISNGHFLHGIKHCQ